ncbi:MAG: helix-turn-helix transcriptional regulator [Bacteroidales bacterium]|nr:helix-turn-helix transcriptional regulator [Bacteroidales bacterium]
MRKGLMIVLIVAFFIFLILNQTLISLKQRYDHPEWLFSIVEAVTIFFFLYFIFNFYTKKAKKSSLHQLIAENRRTDNPSDNLDIENNLPDYISQKNLNHDLKTQIIYTIEEQIEAKVFLDPDLNLETMAKKCDTNRAYLSRVIHEKYGMNFNNFINQFRIKEAENIICNPSNDIPLKALPQKTGFKCYARFHEAFKKQTGTTPTIFVKNNCFL